jgi:hypothetical protein
VIVAQPLIESVRIRTRKAGRDGDAVRVSISCPGFRSFHQLVANTPTALSVMNDKGAQYGDGAVGVYNWHDVRGRESYRPLIDVRDEHRYMCVASEVSEPCLDDCGGTRITEFPQQPGDGVNVPGMRCPNHR